MKGCVDQYTVSKDKNISKSLIYLHPRLFAANAVFKERLNIGLRQGFPKEYTSTAILKSEEEGATEGVVVVATVKCGMASWENKTESVSCLQLQDEGIGCILKTIGSL